MTASARRHQPLVAKAIGFSDGEVWVARSNWDRVEVRNEHGVLRWQHEIQLPGERLLGASCFVRSWLVCALDSGTMGLGFRVWDFTRESPVMVVGEISADGPWVYGSVAEPPLLLTYDRDGVAFWDIKSRVKQHVIPLAEPPTFAAYCSARELLAYAAWERIVLTDRNGSELRSLRIEGCEVDDFVWSGNGDFVVGAPPKRPTRIWNAESAEVVETLPEHHAVLAASACGRWIALRGGLLDLRDFAVREQEPADVAAFEPGAGRLVMADPNRTWRIDLPG